MAQQTINIGTTANDGTGDTIRDAFDKCNDNFTELYAAAGSSGVTVSSQSGTTYTLVLGDASSHVRFTNAGAVTVTVPANASVAYATGTTITLEQAGAGQVTVQGDTGVTVRVAAGNGNATREQYAVVEVRKVAADEWVLYGNLAEAP